MSILISDLKTVPGIIGGLGLGIADAQKELNADYLRSVAALVDLVRALIPGQDDPDPAKREANREAMKNLLIQLAPPRYQYTRTELQVRMDLSQTMDRATSLGGGFALGAVAVNGSYAMAFTQEYRAAAECHTVIEAILPTGDNAAIFQELVAAARTQPAAALPAKVEGHDAKVMELASTVATKLGLKPETSKA